MQVRHLEWTCGGQHKEDGRGGGGGGGEGVTSDAGRIVPKQNTPVQSFSFGNSKQGRRTETRPGF